VLDEGLAERLIPPYVKTAAWLLQSFRVNGYSGSSAWESPLLHPVRRWAHPYPETTGYTLPTLFDFIHWRSEYTAELRHAIDSSIDWLLSLQMESGAFPGGHSLGSQKFYLYTSDYVFRRKRVATESIFNSGQVLRGLLRFYGETRRADVLDAVRRCVRFLVSSVNRDGSWKSDAYARQTSPSYFTYVSGALLEAYSLLLDEAMCERIELSLDYVRSRVDRKTGFIRRAGFNGMDFAHTHTIGYAIQGLLEAARKLGRGGLRFREAATHSLDRLCLILEERKGLAGGFGIDWAGDWTYSCVTGECQLALCFLDLYGSSRDQRYLEAAYMLYSRVRSAQSRRGAFPGSVPLRGKYMSFRWPNWAAKYFMDLTVQLMGAIRTSDS
jgi:hypothetical protein